MTREDTIMVLSVLRGAYPSFYRGADRHEAEDTVSLWASLFADDDVRIVTAAVKALIVSDVKGFPPVPGQVKEYIRKLTMPKELTEGEAWALVAKAVSNGLYGSQEEFAKLPEDVQLIVGSPSQLRDWAAMESETVHSVVASNFQRAYRTRQQAKREYIAIPADVRAMLESAAGGKELVKAL